MFFIHRKHVVKKDLGQTYTSCLLCKNHDVFSIGIYFLYAPHIYSKIKQKQVPIYKQNVDDPVRPHPGCLTLPYNQTNQTPTYKWTSALYSDCKSFCGQAFGCFRINSKR